MNEDRCHILTTLSLLAVGLLLVASLAGILLDDGGSPIPYTTLRGETVEIYGGFGPYRFDNSYKAIAFRSFDWINLLVILPLFALSLRLYRRGRFLGQLLMAALFTYLAYIFLIGVMGNAFNTLFLVWTALFSSGVFGLYLILAQMDFSTLPIKLARRFPRKSVAIYVLAVGIILLVQYSAEIFTAYSSGQPPASLDQYTTLELAALELGLMIPLHIIGGLALWRKKPWGFLIAAVLIFTVFMVFISLSLSLCLFQISFGRGDPLDMAITFGITLVAGGFSVVIVKGIKE